MNRTDERNIVFEILFSKLFNNEKDADQLISDYSAYSEIKGFSEYVVNTVNGVINNIEDIDAKIKDTIKSRKFERLDSICLTAMRLAVYEMFYNDEIPTSVAINEAIELTKKYDDSLAAFVHGNLSLIAKSTNE